MSQIAVRLNERELARLDSLVAEGGFRSRAEAVRAGIEALTASAREQRIAAAYASAYATSPLTSEESEMLDAAAQIAADLPL
jgi:Arc/MetJ-type ribon-helix-helix transcriptional regulator